MKPSIRYLFIIGLAIIAIVFVIFYREYMGEDSVPTAEESANSLINKQLNAVVTDASVSKTTDSLYSYKIDYTDIYTKETSSFFMNYRDSSSVAIGDTVTKEKGEKLLLIYKRQGIVTSIPIE